MRQSKCMFISILILCTASWLQCTPSNGNDPLATLREAVSECTKISDLCTITTTALRRPIEAAIKKANEKDKASLAVSQQELDFLRDYGIQTFKIQEEYLAELDEHATEEDKRRQSKYGSTLTTLRDTMLQILNTADSSSQKLQNNPTFSLYPFVQAAQKVHIACPNPKSILLPFATPSEKNYGILKNSLISFVVGTAVKAYQIKKMPSSSAAQWIARFAYIHTGLTCLYNGHTLYKKHEQYQFVSKAKNVLLHVKQS